MGDDVRRATAQHGGGGSVGGARLESAAAAKRGGARDGGVPEAERGNGVGAGLWHGAAKPTVVADWRGVGWSSGGGRAELTGKQPVRGSGVGMAVGRRG
uniref:OSJNBa0014F04.21 protein n=1 Tax=Oryza sativa subsp. japonica TaxID=39947 RepID=Q7X8I1_ORYSJ|nr:OSJNBa0014F04.21 [Oryza sativa Japonica Group]